MPKVNALRAEFVGDLWRITAGKVEVETLKFTATAAFAWQPAYIKIHPCKVICVSANPPIYYLIGQVPIDYIAGRALIGSVEIKNILELDKVSKSKPTNNLSQCPIFQLLEGGGKHGGSSGKL